MVVVYLKNGEKAPMPNANYVKLEALGESSLAQVLRCYFGNTEVGYFKWDDVSGYTISTLHAPDPSFGSNNAWNQRLQT